MMIYLKTIYLFFISTFITLFIVSCDMGIGELDNYEEPNGSIYGTIMNSVTNEPLQSEQPDGIQIKLYEKDMPAPINFWGKGDGTFKNSFIFQNEYKVIPEGAFFPVDTVNVSVGKNTEVNFTVIPFLVLTNVSVQSESGQITVNYEIKRPEVGDKIVERRVLVSDVPTVNNSSNVMTATTPLSNINDETILATTFTDVVTGLDAGKTYYVRVAAKTANYLDRYNFSKVFKVTL